MPKPIDREAVRESWKLKREGKTQNQIAQEAHRSLRQVQRYLDPSWLAERGLGELQYCPGSSQESGPGQTPATPIQQEAWDRCQNGDHSWMIPESKFEGQSFTRETRYESPQETAQYAPEEPLWPTPTIRHTDTCYHCGYPRITRGSGAI